MDSKQEKSWTITEVVDLVKDLGPRENTARSYKLFKNLRSSIVGNFAGRLGATR